MKYATIQSTTNHTTLLKRVLLFLGFIFIFSIIVTTGTSAQITQKSVKQELPKEKETTLGLYVTAKEAFKMWESAPEKIKILDVRTPEEYIFVGHAEMAWNVPFATQSYDWDNEKKVFKFKPNQDFLTDVKAIAAPEDTLLVMCRSGGRSAMAVNQLAAAGFSHAYSITDGMEGDFIKEADSAFKGQHMKNGWKNAGLPWTYELNPKQMKLPSGQ